jgi:hypothetical protein
VFKYVIEKDSWVGGQNKFYSRFKSFFLKVKKVEKIEK